MTSTGGVENTGGVGTPAPATRPTDGRFSGPIGFLRRKADEGLKKTGTVIPEGQAHTGFIGALNKFAKDKPLFSEVLNADFEENAAKEAAGAQATPLTESRAPAEATAAKAFENLKPQNAASKTDFNLDDFVKKYEDNPKVQKYLKPIAKGLEEGKKKPTEAQAKAIVEIIKEIEKVDDDEFKSVSPNYKNDFLKEAVKQIMKEKSENIDIKDITQQTTKSLEDRMKKNEEIFDDLMPCFTNEKGGYAVNDKGHVTVNRIKLRKIKNNLEGKEKEKYEALVKELPEDMKGITPDTKHLHLILVAQAKSDEKMKPETLEKLKNAQKNGKLSEMEPKEFFNHFKDIVGSKYVNEMRKKLEDLDPKDDDEIKALTDQLVGDGKLYSKDDWKKLSPKERRDALRAQKHENQMMKNMPDDMRKKLEGMDPDLRRQALEKMAQGPLGTPQAMQNQMTPEMQKKMFEAQQNAANAAQENAKQMTDGAMKNINAQHKMQQDTLGAMMQGISSMVKGIEGLVQGLKDMRDKHLQHTMNQAMASQARQDAMMEKQGKLAASTTSS